MVFVSWFHLEKWIYFKCRGFPGRYALNYTVCECFFGGWGEREFDGNGVYLGRARPSVVRYFAGAIALFRRNIVYICTTLPPSLQRCTPFICPLRTTRSGRIFIMQLLPPQNLAVSSRSTMLKILRLGY